MNDTRYSDINIYVNSTRCPKCQNFLGKHLRDSEFLICPKENAIDINCHADRDGECFGVNVLN